MKRKSMDSETSGQVSRPQYTLETLRLEDKSIVTEQQNVSNDERELIACDEFANCFNSTKTPKIAITYSDTAGTETRQFAKDLVKVIANSKIYARRHANVKDVVQAAINHHFSDLLILNTNKRKPNRLLHVHLPNGPTASYKLSSVKTADKISKKTSFPVCRTQVLTNRFETTLGKTVERMFSSLFHRKPSMSKRRIVVFHNQRDYIFFRHYFYDVEKSEKGVKARTHELGPRFTCKLQSLQLGTFDSKCGEYEWVIEDKRHQMEKSRRRFYL